MGLSSASDANFNQVAVGAVDTTVLAFNGKRLRVTLRNFHATNTAFIGKTGVTIGNGFPLPAGAELTLETRSEIHAIAAVASSIGYAEETS